MNRRRVYRCHQSVGAALVLVLTISTGCSFVSSQICESDATRDDFDTTEVIPILVTLAAEEGQALAAARMRVLARLRQAMSPDSFATVRTYEMLPIVAVAATPEIVALLLALPDVRSVEADRAFEALVSDPGRTIPTRCPTTST